MFYKSQLEVANALCELIDLYWDNNIKEQFMIEGIKKIVDNNKDKIIRDNEYTAVIRQKCGKRRLDVISKII